MGVGGGGGGGQDSMFCGNSLGENLSWLVNFFLNE